MIQVRGVKAGRHKRRTEVVIEEWGKKRVGDDRAEGIWFEEGLQEEGVDAGVVSKKAHLEDESVTMFRQKSKKRNRVDPEQEDQKKKRKPLSFHLEGFWRTTAKRPLTPYPS